MKTLFLTLRTFSTTGGIEKVCCILGKALFEDSIKYNGALSVCSMYDQQSDAFNNQYFPSENFVGFGKNKLKFIARMILQGSRSDLVILSHINLLPVGWMIKKTSPKTKLVLLGHGIEIWYPLSKRKKKMLKCFDSIIAVSNFTKNKIVKIHDFDSTKCFILNNCLDPFLPFPSFLGKKKELLNKYKFKETDFILMTLTRLSSTERYKGYDKVIESMITLKKSHPEIKYLICGASDKAEKLYIDTLIMQNGMQNYVVMAGFVPEKEFEDYFSTCDMYVMPSKKEGFGIVFIEAMNYGLPVVAGNMDGSTDALLQGMLGQLVNPDDVEQITNAITNVIENRNKFIPNRKLLMEYFSYENYKLKLEVVLHK